MTPGQIAQLQELARCWNLPVNTKYFIDAALSGEFFLNRDALFGKDRLTKSEEAGIRCLWHQYRGQIAAMKRNRQA